jgi:hypothetical protein
MGARLHHPFRHVFTHANEVRATVNFHIACCRLPYTCTICPRVAGQNSRVLFLDKAAVHVVAAKQHCLVVPQRRQFMQHYTLLFAS